MNTGAKLNMFCRKAQMSVTYYYTWMRGEIEPSEEMCDRITTYIDEVYKK